MYVNYYTIRRKLLHYHGCEHSNYVGPNAEQSRSQHTTFFYAIGNRESIDVVQI